MRATAQERLRASGLRSTAPRATVLGVLQRAAPRREHLAASQVADRARAELGSLSTQAVYDCLEALTRVGLARASSRPATRRASRAGWATTTTTWCAAAAG